MVGVERAVGRAEDKKLNEFYLPRFIQRYSYLLSLGSYGEQEAFDNTCILVLGKSGTSF
jgi:hypothetical protein